MTLGRLAGHIAEIPSWVSATIDLDELDFSKMDYKPFVGASTEELVKKLDENAAKGLEFKVVFIAGVEDGLIPLRMRPEGESEVEEERRLFYVAMTRAKDELILTHSRSRCLYGRHAAARPSPFLLEIPQEFIKQRMVENKPASRKQRQMKLF